MEPILLNKFGETLVRLKGVGITKVLSDEDEYSLNYCYIGVHGLCNGFMYSLEISKTHNCIYCNVCKLRIVFPKEIDTYGKLREWCDQNIEAEKLRSDRTDYILRTSVPLL